MLDCPKRDVPFHCVCITLPTTGERPHRVGPPPRKRHPAMAQPRQYTVDNLLVRPQHDASDPDLILSITPETAGWDYIHFQARRLATGQRWSFHSGEHELALINFTGRYRVDSNRGSWQGIGGRQSVFTGAAHALYLPRRTE